MLLSGRRLDHLSLLAETSDEITTEKNELIHFQDQANISSYQYLYLERHQHLDSDFVKAVVYYYSKIKPDDIVSFEGSLAVLKDNKTIVVPEGIYRQILDFDFSLYQGYFLVSGALAVLAWHEYQQENVNVKEPKIACGKYVLVKNQTLRDHIARVVRSLQEKGWEYVNYITDYQGIYEEFAQEWNLQTKHVVVGKKKYYFVRTKEKYFLGTLERWISESLTLLVKGSLPVVYITYPYKSLPLTSPEITVTYMAVRAYAKLVENNTLLANMFDSIRVHSDLSIEAKFFNVVEVQQFQKLLTMSSEKVYVHQVKDFYHGVLFKYVYQDALLLYYNEQNYLVRERDFVDINDPVNEDMEIEKDLRTHLTEFYTFCQPKVSNQYSLKDLLSIVPEFTSYEPLKAICEVDNASVSGVSEFIYQTLEYAWRGYYTYANMKGLIPFIPYTPPEPNKAYNIVELGEMKLLAVSLQGIEVVIGIATKNNIKKWEEEKYFTLWEKYYIRKYNKLSKVLLSLASKTSLA